MLLTPRRNCCAPVTSSRFTVSRSGPSVRSSFQPSLLSHKRRLMVLPAHIPHLSLTEGVARLPLTARDILTRPPTGRHFSPATPSDCFTIDFPRRATSPGEGLRFALLLFTDKGRSQVVLDCAHRTSTFLSCAFCEQKGHLATPFLPLLAAPETIAPPPSAP